MARPFCVRGLAPQRGAGLGFSDGLPFRRRPGLRGVLDLGSSLPARLGAEIQLMNDCGISADLLLDMCVAPRRRVDRPKRHIELTVRLVATMSPKLRSIPVDSKE